MWTMSLTPLPPCGLTWTIERPPPSPYLSTWFMNAAIVKEPELHFDSESQDKSLFADLIENIT